MEKIIIRRWLDPVTVSEEISNIKKDYEKMVLKYSDLVLTEFN